MNRLEEYTKFVNEIDIMCCNSQNELEDSISRAKKRMTRRNRILRPVISFTAVFILFVGLVNFCTPVAYACAKVPFLKELAEAVTFSPSLTEAVKNEYTQEINLSQTDNDITASVEYLIVDQKQVNVFFRIESDVYEHTNIRPIVLNEEGGFLGSCSYGLNDWDVPNGELQSVTIDFIEKDVPDTLRLKLCVSDSAIAEQIEEAPVDVEEDMFTDVYEEPEYIAEFDFLLKFIPGFTASGKIYELNQEIVLDEQTIIIKNIEVFPSHLRVNVEDVSENTAWIKELEFCVKTDRGKTFETISNGITATGSGDTKSMTSFRAESTYFYDAKELTLEITGAKFLKKDMEKLHVNLKTGETDKLPEGIEFYKAEKESGGWLVEFLGKQLEENHTYQLFYQTYYDKNGNEYEINAWSSGGAPIDERYEGYFVESFPLKGYSEDEVWLSPAFSHIWEAETPIEVKIYD